MKANVFRGTNEFGIEEVERPRAGTGEAVIRVTLTTICGTDLHIVRGEYPVEKGRIIGHEPVGVIEELGAGVTGYSVGDRVLVGPSRPAASATPACPGTSRSAARERDTRRSEDGSSGTRCMGRRPSTSASRTPRPTSRRSRPS